MYRGRLWTMRQFAGFGTAEDTNERYKFLLERGQTGLSVAFDFPTLMGYDSDHPRSEGEVGKCGVAISSLADMETLFDGIPLDQVSTSMTINGPAAMLFCFYVAAAEKQGVPHRPAAGHDPERHPQGVHGAARLDLPAEPALKIIVDLFEWAAEHTPKWNTISISGYHIREAGATAAQELAFTLAERLLLRGARPRPRAATWTGSRPGSRSSGTSTTTSSRRSPSSAPRGGSGPGTCASGTARGIARSWRMRFHCQTAGVTLTAQQPQNNVVRVAYQALAAVLGGTQSLHTNALDETLALPDRGVGARRAPDPADPGVRDRRRPTWPIRWAARTTWRR